MEEVYDILIIGAGPAGITASVYAARKKMSVLVISKDIGGQAAWSGDVENYTGYQFISGPALVARFEEHMHTYNVQLRENEEALGLDKTDNGILIKTSKGKYRAKTVIIASGKRSRELNVPGEEEFKNKGLTYCATCDGPLFAARQVAVVGGGNSALDAILQLLRIAAHIYVVNNAPQLGGDAVMRQKVESSSKVSVFNNSKVTAVLGDKMVTALKVQGPDKEEQLTVGGVFVEIGLIPNSDFATGIAKNELGEIKVNCRNETNIPGVFAAGDVTDVVEKQIIIAAGEGAKASLSAFRYLAQAVP
ncbi:MAG: FAD-binding protein [Candidatus Omnitrophota bacterium]|jgi:alkyl hydroperoxide reductase subunit F|nr:MAG: FAD-binding protein [Candidatus Omnitrophota bacterium]